MSGASDDPPPMQERRREAVEIEVAALETDIRHHLVDLEVAFATRDWTLVARIYRATAAIADRLEDLDPAARSRDLERLEREQEAREAARAGDGSDDGDALDDAPFGHGPGGARDGRNVADLLPDDLPDDGPGDGTGFDPDDFSPWRPR